MEREVDVKQVMQKRKKKRKSGAPAREAKMEKQAYQDVCQMELKAGEEQPFSHRPKP